MIYDIMTYDIMTYEDMTMTYDVMTYDVIRYDVKTCTHKPKRQHFHAKTTGANLCGAKQLVKNQDRTRPELTQP